MPICQLYTNIPDKDIKDGIEERIASTVGKVLNKPLERLNVVVVPGVRLYRNGSSDLGCCLTISSIGVFDKERNPGYTGPIKEMIMEELNLPKERIMLVYQDLDKDMVGW